MKEISLPNGSVALVDDEDYNKIVSYPYKWAAMKRKNTCYAKARRLRSNSCILMHRFILGEENECQVDHIDHNGLNNCKSNLRLVDSSQQHMNQEKRKDTSSIYKGVSYIKAKKKWQATIKKDYKSKNLGCFDTEKEAALAYDVAAQELFGEYAKLNFSWKVRNETMESII